MTGTTNRRHWIYSALAAAGAERLCCVTQEVSPGALLWEQGVLRIDLPKSGSLAKKNSAVQVVDQQRQVNLIVVHAKSGRFAALHRSCTHGGAQVVFNRENQTVQCTSWGHSEFSLDGEVLGGSAKKPLPAIKVRRVGNTLELKLA